MSSANWGGSRQGYDPMVKTDDRHLPFASAIPDAETSDYDHSDDDEPDKGCCSLDNMLAEDGWFTDLTIVVICLNTVVMALEADYPPAENNTEAMWTHVNNVFLTYFVCEITLRLYHSGCKEFFCSSNSSDFYWNWFDFVIVSFGVLDQWLLNLVLDLFGKGSNEGHEGQGMSKMLMILRTLRICRILRAVRVINFFPSLNRLVKGLFGSITSVGYVALLFFINLLVFSIIICNIVGKESSEFEDPEQIEIWFGTIGRCMQTLFTFLTCDDWSSPVRMVNKKMPLMEIVWLLYMFIGTFTLISLLTGMMADQMNNAREEEEEEKEDNQEKTILEKITEIEEKSSRESEGGNGNTDYVTEDSFRIMLQKHDKDLKKLGLAFENDEVEEIFRVIDVDKKKQVKKEEFAKSLVKLSAKDVKTKDMLWAEAALMKVDTKIREITRSSQHTSTHWGTRVNNLEDRARALQEKVAMMEDDLIEFMEKKGARQAKEMKRLRKRSDTKLKTHQTASLIK